MLYGYVVRHVTSQRYKLIQKHGNVPTQLTLPGRAEHQHREQVCQDQHEMSCGYDRDMEMHKLCAEVDVM